jgi:hypothetical protein
VVSGHQSRLASTTVASSTSTDEQASPRRRSTASSSSTRRAAIRLVTCAAGVSSAMGGVGAPESLTRALYAPTDSSSACSGSAADVRSCSNAAWKAATSLAIRVASHPSSGAMSRATDSAAAAV